MKLQLLLPAALAAMGFSCFTATAAGAADLAIGMGFDIATLDPHFSNVTPNSVLAAHIFGRLVAFDANRKLQPQLAESWKNIDELTWEFKLRRGVKFHDGSEFTADDVVYSLDRPATIANSPSTFTLYTKAYIEKQAVDKYTVRLKTATPYALVLSDLSTIFIVSKKAASGLSTEDFNAGKGMVGTGPYKFVQWQRGNRVELARNEAYWGTKPEWDKVTLRMMTSAPARVAALLAGDVQMIEGVPPADMAKLKGNPDLKLFSTVSSRVIFLNLDQQREVSPFITDKLGQPLGKNPLKDYRVRLAISKAINRPAIVDKVMEGNAIAASQFLPPGFYGTAPGLKVEAPDVEGAKKLLAEAGYPDGFGLTLHGTNDRYVNDAKILQTIAQMLSRVGITVKVDAMPLSVFFGRQTKLEFSMSMSGWGGGSGHPNTYLKGLVTSYNPQKGYGSNNIGRYSNPTVDTLVDQAFVTIDTVRQEQLWQQATTLVMGDLGIMPLHYQMNVWAARKGYSYVPRSDEWTLGYEVTSVK
ncbi:MAG: ABC transporter substrate-binding protein [Pseudomonadota bacterium]